MEPNKIKFLDGFRFILALWVVIAHFYTFIGGITYYKFPGAIEDILMRPIIAVYGFMIITGFLMMYNYLQRQEKEPPYNKYTFVKFWLRRFFRLYPLYMLLLLTAFFSFTYIAQQAANNLTFFTGSNVTQWGFVRSTAQPGLADLASHIFLVHGLFPQFHDSILGVTWSLSLEMQFYFLFPFIFLFIFKNEEQKKSWLVIVLIVCTFLAIISPKVFHLLSVITHTVDFKLPSVITFGMPLFLLGMIMAGVKLKKINIVYLIISLVLFIPFQLKLTTLVMSLLLIFLFLDELRAFIPETIFNILNTCRSILSGKVAEFGADISYSIYLVHTLIITVVLDQLIRYAGALGKTGIIGVGLVASLIICFLICYLLFRFVEKPFITVGKKMVSKIGKKKTPDVAIVDPVAS